MSLHYLPIWAGPWILGVGEVATARDILSVAIARSDDYDVLKCLVVLRADD